jgi:Uma2 family endonuclease
MSAAVPHHVFTYREYLEREKETGLKHEFHRGQIYAMAGGAPEHARLIAAMTIAIGRIVDPRKCRIFTSELKVRVQATGLATYPDVTVVCGEASRDGEDPNAIVNPKLVVEVLSAGTEAYDRGEKWAHYRLIESLEAYVLASQVPERVEIYERIPVGQDHAGAFLHRSASPGEALAIRCLDGAITVDDLYLGAL